MSAVKHVAHLPAGLVTTEQYLALGAPRVHSLLPRIYPYCSRHSNTTTNTSSSTATALATS